MTWLNRLFGRDHQVKRIAAAQEQQEEAAELLRGAREVSSYNRERVAHNHLTEGFAAAFETRRRERRA